MENDRHTHHVINLYITFILKVAIAKISMISFYKYKLSFEYSKRLKYKFYCLKQYCHVICFASSSALSPKPIIIGLNEKFPVVGDVF